LGVSGDTLELYADHHRQLATIDPDGRALLVSCGGALYLARLALAAGGWQVDVDRLPDPTRPDLLARLRMTGRGTVDEATRVEAAAAQRRQTDRRPFRTEPVPEMLLDDLTKG
jgi:hypothetical protein